MKDQVEIFTGGACRGNPGPGGWGVLLRFQGKEKTLHGGELETTNNRMELMAAIIGLESLNEACGVTLTTDSKYVMHRSEEHTSELQSPDQLVCRLLLEKNKKCHTYLTTQTSALPFRIIPFI